MIPEAYPHPSTTKHKTIPGTILDTQRIVMSKLRFFSLLLWVPSMVHVQAFSASPQPSFFDSITSIFKGDAMMAKSATDNRRNDLKKELLDLCQNDVVDRKNVEAIIDDLKEVRPFDGTANDPSLQKEWLL